MIGYITSSFRWWVLALFLRISEALRYPIRVFASLPPTLYGMNSRSLPLRNAYFGCSAASGMCRKPHRLSEGTSLLVCDDSALSELHAFWSRTSETVGCRYAARYQKQRASEVQPYFSAVHDGDEISNSRSLRPVRQGKGRCSEEKGSCHMPSSPAKEGRWLTFTMRHFHLTNQRRLICSLHRRLHT